jgi:hypothetical protein
MLTLPMAPSDGLFLDKAFFEQYNDRATQIGLAASLDWEDEKMQGKIPSLSVAVLKERVRSFKEEAIVDHITKSEGKVRREKKRRGGGGGVVCAYVLPFLPSSSLGVCVVV